MMTYEMIAALYPIEKDHKGSKTIYHVTLERGVVLTIVIGDRENMEDVFNKYIKPRKLEPIDIRPYSYLLTPDTIFKPSKELGGELSEAAKERLKDLDFMSTYSSLVMLDSKDALDTASKLIDMYHKRRAKLHSISDEEEE